MLRFLLLQFIFGQLHHDYSHNLPSVIYNHLRHLHGHLNHLISPEQNSHTRDRSEHNGKIVFTHITCVDTTRCADFRRGLDRMKELFTNVLLLNEDINVRVSIRDFCKAEGCSDTVASAGPAKMIDLKDETGFRISYASSLAKQHGLHGDYSKRETDIDININVEHPYYFGSSGQGSDRDVVLVDVLSHEFLHGLGFGAGFTVLDKQETCVAPLEISRESDGKIYVFSAGVNAFMKYFRDNETTLPLLPIYRRFNIIRPGTRYNNIEHMMADIHAKGLYSYCVKISSLMKADKRVSFLAKSQYGESSMFLQSANKGFGLEEAWSHSDVNTYQGTVEALMGGGTSKPGTFIPTKENVPKRDSGPITDLYLDILGTMGYKTIRKRDAIITDK